MALATHSGVVEFQTSALGRGMRPQLRISESSQARSHPSSWLLAQSVSTRVRFRGTTCSSPLQIPSYLNPIGRQLPASFPVQKDDPKEPISTLQSVFRHVSSRQPTALSSELAGAHSGSRPICGNPQRGRLQLNSISLHGVVLGPRTPDIPIGICPVCPLHALPDTFPFVRSCPPCPFIGFSVPRDHRKLRQLLSFPGSLAAACIASGECPGFVRQAGFRRT